VNDSHAGENEEKGNFQQIQNFSAITLSFKKTGGLNRSIPFSNVRMARGAIAKNNHHFLIPFSTFSAFWSIGDEEKKYSYIIANDSKI